MRVRRKFPARLSHRMNHASAPLAKDMKLNVRSYSTILYRNVNIKKRPAALAAGRLSSYYRIRWYECQKVFWHSFDTRIATLLRSFRNPPNIRNPLIYCVNRYFLRSASVGAKRTSTGCSAPHIWRVPNSKALSCKHEQLFDLLTLVSSNKL